LYGIPAYENQNKKLFLTRPSMNESDRLAVFARNSSLGYHEKEKDKEKNIRNDT
jgi:hypothetical protein